MPRQSPELGGWRGRWPPEGEYVQRFFTSIVEPQMASIERMFLKGDPFWADLVPTSMKASLCAQRQETERYGFPETERHFFDNLIASCRRELRIEVMARKLAPKLPSFCRMMERNYEPFRSQYVQDAVLSAYIRVIEGALGDDIPNTREQLSWKFLGICRNELRKDILKLQPRIRDSSVDLDIFVAKEGSPWQELAAQEEAAIRKKVSDIALNFNWLLERADLSPRQAELVLLLFGETRLSQVEASKVLKVSASTISRELNKALTKLRETLKREGLDVLGS